MLDEGDKEKLIKQFEDCGLKLDPDSIVEIFTYERFSRYKGGEYLGDFFNVSLDIKVRTKQQRKFRSVTFEESRTFSSVMKSMMPVIAYFPTFVFDFPEKIYLTSRESTKTNPFYRQLFQDILDYAGRGHTIEEHITKRIRKPEYKMEWVGFLPVFRRSTEGEKIDQVIDLASQIVTQVVYKRWNEIFHENTGKKEIQINWDVEEGLKTSQEDGTEAEADEHDIYVRFQVKDGTDRFPIKTRSLGFRWFFFLFIVHTISGRSRYGQAVGFPFR